MSSSNEIESIDLSTATEGSANETFHMVRNQISKEEKLHEATLCVFKIGENYQSYHHLRNIADNYSTQWEFCVCISGQVITCNRYGHPRRKKEETVMRKR